jgi:hypothetical protein
VVVAVGTEAAEEEMEREEREREEVEREEVEREEGGARSTMSTCRPCLLGELSTHRCL